MTVYFWNGRCKQDISETGTIQKTLFRNSKSPALNLEDLDAMHPLTRTGILGEKWRRPKYMFQREALQKAEEKIGNDRAAVETLTELEIDECEMASNGTGLSALNPRVRKHPPDGKQILRVPSWS